MEACIQSCASTPSCVAVVWVTGPKACYLKSQVGARSSESGVIGAYFPGVFCAGGTATASGSASSTLMASSSSTTSSVTVSPTSPLSSSPTSSPTSLACPVGFDPSLNSKRGLVYVSDGFNSQDDHIWVEEGSDLNWYYNYMYTPTPSYVNCPQLQYVPMLFGDFDSNFTQTIIDMIQSGINVSYILSFNEPDGTFATGGSQIAPPAAAARWMSDIAPLGAYGIQLGAPAVTGSQGGFQWLQEFFTACNGSCNATFVPIHWYGNFQGLASEIGQMHATYPNMTIWVTEFADAWDTLSSTQTNFNESIQYLDRLPYVIRYSYFGSFRSSVSNVGANATMLDQCGRLTDIGDWYLDMPPQGITPQSITCSTSTPISNQMNSNLPSYSSSNIVATSAAYTPTSYSQPSSIPNPSQISSTPSPYLGPTSSSSSTVANSTLLLHPRFNRSAHQNSLALQVLQVRY